MRRSVAGIIILVIGLVLVVFAPVWKWGIAPMLTGLPDDLNITSTYEGTLTLHVDPTTLAILPPEMAVKIPLTITRTDVSQPKKSDGTYAVVRETVVAKGPGGKDFLSWEKFYAMKRSNSENVPGHGSDINRTGFYLLLPGNTQKKGYAMWDDDNRASAESKYVKTVKISGFKTQNANGYVFTVAGKPAPMFAPPLGLPTTISGASAKAITGNTSLPVVDTQQYPITYLKDTSATIIVETKTGTIADVHDYTEDYYVDASQLGQANIKLATLHYAQTPESVKQVIDDAGKYFKLLDLANMWIPLISLILGIILAILGVVLIVLKRRKATA